MELKKYSFKIFTVKNVQDKNSPYELLSVFFLAKTDSEAEKFKKTMIENFEKNQPCLINLPYQITQLISSEI